MANLVRKVFSCDATWTAPAGVYSLKAIAVPMTQIQNLAIGLNQSIAIINTCDAYAWGRNLCGETGTGNLSQNCQPTLVGCSLKWKNVVAGATNSGGITTAGDAYMWGQSACGILGNNQIANAACLPSLVCCGFKWKALSVAANTALGILCSGDAYGWGSNCGGGLGNGSQTIACQPTLVCCGLKWRYIVSGISQTSAGITTAGDLYTWGSGPCGIQGVGSTTNKCLPTPTCCNFKWKMVAVGRFTMGGITCSGDLYMWGANFCGVLGVGTTSGFICQPQLVCCGLKWKWFAIGQGASGNDGALGLDVCGNAYTWGDSSCGFAGTNSNTGTCLPSPVCCAFKWRSVSVAQGASSIAGGITAEGLLYMWGSGNCGGLGINSATSQCQPALVCCGFTYGPLANQVEKIFNVIPGTTYPVGVFGQFPNFQGDPITQDFSIQSVILEYFA